jgi:hypothetical protein
LGERKMLDRVHKIAEIVAAFALVASLLFVGIQISQNTSTMRAESHQAAVNVWANMATPLATNERLATLYSQDVYPELKSALSSPDQTSLSAYIQSTFYVIESHYHRWLVADLPDEVWSSFRTALFDTLVANQSAMTYWNGAGDRHTPEFIALVNDMIPAVTKRRAEFAAFMAEQKG